MQKFGIDISKWQGTFSIKDAIKNHSIEFAILKIGGGDNVCYKDKKFDDYYKQCKDNNLPVGCYYFGHAMTTQKAKEEVKHWLSLMDGKQFEYPVFYDVEGDMLTLDRRTLTDIVKYVCTEIEKHGYWVGIYGSASKFNNKFYDNELKGFSHWVAGWSSKKPSLFSGATIQMWQFGGETNKLQSNKINGKTVDQDFCYVDYPTLIKTKGLNNFKTNSNTNKKTDEQIAFEVIDGLWGNGEERKASLTKAGYDYKAVQKLVNAILKQ